MGEAGPLGEVVRTSGWGGLRRRREAAGGAMGRVFRVETSVGVWAVKELFPHEHGEEEASGHEHDEAAELERQAAFVEAAVKVGVAAPRMVRSADGEIVATVGGVRWRVFEW